MSSWKNIETLNSGYFYMFIHSIIHLTLFYYCQYFISFCAEIEWLWIRHCLLFCSLIILHFSFVICIPLVIHWLSVQLFLMFVFVADCALGAGPRAWQSLLYHTTYLAQTRGINVRRWLLSLQLGNKKQSFQLIYSNLDLGEIFLEPFWFSASGISGAPGPHAYFSAASSWKESD